jgi:hypothetical protein
MQNLNLSKDGHFCEDWIREVYQESTGNEELEFLIPATVNFGEELYCCDNTTVWSSELCTAKHDRTDGEICYTSESPIQFAFFCTKNFLGASYKIDLKPSKLPGNVQGIEIIDVSSLKVYATNGENLVTSIESPIKIRIWS